MRSLIGEGESALHLQTPGDRGTPSRTPGKDTGFLTEAEMRAFERENTRAALEKADWRIYGDGGAADLLGIRPTTLNSRIAKMGLERPS